MIVESGAKGAGGHEQHIHDEPFEEMKVAEWLID